MKGICFTQRTVLLCLVLITTSFFSRAQTATLLNHLTVDEVYELLADLGVNESMVDLNYEVDFYRVEYKTLHPNGDSVDVTGALCLPSNLDCPLPLNSYQHGTTSKKTKAPSYQSTESSLGVLYASAGYASVMPDYIGLGDSEGTHLYVHAASEASTSLDLIQAAHTLQDELGYELNDQLFLWGYSQGGHATMALHRLIETEYSDVYTVTACAPMSGPYDISGAQAGVITSDQPYPTPGYLPYVVLSYQAAYGNIYESLDEVFLPEYAAIIPELFNGNYGMGYINDQFPDVPSEMVLPAVLDDFQNNPNHPLRLALADNDVYDWAPLAPTHLYYCNADDQVTYLNSIVALDTMLFNGSTAVEAFDGGPFDHGVCAPFAMLAGYNFFESLREAPFAPQYEAVITPSSGNDGSIEVIIEAADATWTYSWSTGDGGTMISGLTAGEYTLSISDGSCSVELHFEVPEAVGVLNLSAPVDVIISPNPSIGVVRAQQSGVMVIYSVQQQEVYRQNVIRGQELDLSRLADGAYVVVLDGARLQRFLLQRK